MSDIIHLLPDNIVNQIAAGEVIQRPASAVKELLENAVDAGSTSIKLIVKNAGKTLIQVIDNGCSMSETDARMSFERHATSKISNVDDLFAVRTMGFRGEALASIAAVAQVEMKTKRKSDEIGTQLIIEGSEVKSQEPEGCKEGTSIAVKNLFYNIPARRNFLKSNSAETRHIIEEFQRVALAYPKVSFSMYHDDHQLYQLPAGKLRQRVVGLLGNNYNERLVPVEEEVDILKITGFIGKPEFSKKTRGEQFFFINNRFIRNAYLNHAVLNAYDNFLPKDCYPLYVIFIDIKTSMVDINVHPTKQEVKFQDERMIYAIIQAAVKRSLGQYNVTPSLDFEQEIGINKAFLDPVSKDISGATIANATFISNKKANNNDWQRLYEDTLQTKKEETDADRNMEGQQFITPDWNTQELDAQETNPYQIHRQFILTHIKSGIIFINQQRAHERILYEKYLHRLSKKQVLSQQQLFPQTVELSSADATLVKDILPEIKILGFDIEEFGKNTFVIRGVPSDITITGEQKILESLIEQYKNHMKILKVDKYETLAISLVHYTSIKPGKALSVAEMTSMIDKLFACKNPYASPTGKSIIIKYSLEEFEKLFDN